jgi:hypothetical protein
MKKMLVHVCGCLCCVVVALSAELQNASFEEPQNDGDWTSEVAANWHRWGQWINRETGWQPTHGGDCLIGYHHWRLEESDSSGIYQDIVDVPAGSACEFSVYVYKDKETNADQLELRMEPYEGGEALVSKKFSMNKLRNDRWKEVSVSGVNLDEGLRVLIIAYPGKPGERAGALKLDDASLSVETE